MREFTKSGYEHAARRFDNAVMARDLKGKFAVVTGANQGLGYQTSLELARRGCTLFMVCRNEARGGEAVAQIKEQSGNADVHLRVRAAAACCGSLLRQCRRRIAKGAGTCQQQEQPPRRLSAGRPPVCACLLPRRSATCPRCSPSGPLPRITCSRGGRCTS